MNVHTCVAYSMVFTVILISFNTVHAQTYNQISTGDMESTGWTSIPGNTNLSISFDANSGIDNTAALKAVTSNMGSDNYYLLRCEESISLTQSDKITVSFWAKGSTMDMRLQPWIQKTGGGNWMNFGDAWLTTHWKQYRFTVSIATQTDNYKVTVRVKVINTAKVPVSGQAVRILPSRHGVTSSTSGNVVSFTLSESGQYSVEIGPNGYKNGLIIFADPPEVDIPSSADPDYLMLYEANASSVSSISGNYSGIYFERGVHNIRIFDIPSHIKNIYFEDGWVYNCDGISAFKGSKVSKCFIWANDDAIKVYRDAITFSDIVVWQLNNGAIIQMSWGGAIGGSTSKNVKISRVDVLRAEWDKPRFNTGLLSCVGNRYHIGGKYALLENWLIEDVVTERPIPQIFNVTPDNYTHNHIHGLTLKNWNVKMVMNTNFKNKIKGEDPNDFLSGFVFDNVRFNNQLLTNINYITTGDMENGGWIGVPEWPISQVLNRI